MFNLCLVAAAFLSICSGQSTDSTVSTTLSDACKSADIHGIIEEGCWGYSECKDNLFVIHKCPASYVLKKSTLECVIKGTSGTECDNTTDCANMPDAMYANVADTCHSYYRCYGAVNVGQFYCPAFLVFNNAIQGCDFPSNVGIPCGSLPTPTVPPKRMRRRRSARRARRAEK